MLPGTANNSIVDGLPVGTFVIQKDEIAVAADFPAPNQVSLGMSWRVTATVTDDDPSKTNTGQSFVAGNIITWDGDSWAITSQGASASEVTAIVGTPDQVNVSSPTGNVTLSLPQDIAPSSSPTFDELDLSATPPTRLTQAVTKSYVDDSIIAIGGKAPALVATTGNLTATYNNGASGLGATLTNSGTQALLNVDGKDISIGDRMLVWQQTVALQNGVYEVTDPGSPSSNYVLTRSTDFDGNPPGEISAGNLVNVTSGDTYANYNFRITTLGTIIVGTTPINFTGSPTVVAGDGITVIGNVVSADINTTNLQFTANQINTIQNINSGAAPTFTGTNFSGIPESGVTNLTTDLVGKQPLDIDLTALAGVSSFGFLCRTAPGVADARQILGSTNKITVTNGDGVLGDATITIATGYVGQTSITTLGTISNGTWNGGIIAGQYGGTGVNNSGKTIQVGGNLTFAGSFTSTFTVTGNTSVTLPTSGTILSTANASGNYVSGITGTSNQITVSGSTGAVTLSLPQDIAPASSPTFTGITLSGTSAHGVLLGQASSAVTSLILGAGQLLIGTTSSNPSAASLTAGTGISITSASGSITIAGNGNDSIVDQTTSSVTMAVNTVYNSNAGASPVIYTLPATAAVGQWVEIVGRATGGWLIAQASGQVIRFGSLTTATGTGGSLASSAQGQTVKLRCTAANTDWQVVYAVGNLQVTA